MLARYFGGARPLRSHAPAFAFAQGLTGRLVVIHFSGGVEGSPHHRSRHNSWGHPRRTQDQDIAKRHRRER